MLTRWIRRSLSSALLGGLTLAGLALPGATGCTRPTVGFCTIDEQCAPGSTCALPDHECVVGTVLAGDFSGSQVVPPTASEASGTFRLVLSADGASATYRVKHTVSKPRRMELLLGGLNKPGQVVRDLGLSESGTLMLDPDTVRALRAGEYSVQVVSDYFNTGEVRAQLFSLDPADEIKGTLTLMAPLSGNQSSPANVSQAKGQFTIELNEQAMTLGYSLTHTGIATSITGLHLHRGGFNVNGPHILDLPLAQGSPLMGTLSRETIEQQLTDPNLYQAQRHVWRMLIRSGLTYLNVHSTEFVKGELRAQLLPNQSVPFNVILNSTSGSQGEGHLFLSADRTQIAVRINHNLAMPSNATLSIEGTPTRTDVVCPDLAMQKGADGSQARCPLRPTELTALLEGRMLLVVTPTLLTQGELLGKLSVPR